MKIIELVLENFSRVYSGLGKTKLVLDFSNVEEQINLFVGDNGTGKTSIMGSIHPFAYNSATGDSTSNSDLIIEKKDGKKIIKILSDDNHLYEITHIYSRKKDDTISLKSFIKEDGEELNDSGTVTTFKTIVYEKLGIDQTYLTLLSIGNTIDGFVNFTSSDRKNYATKIFSELEVYNKYYKNLSIADRNMRALLNNVVSKLSKYSNVNKNEVETNILELERRLNKLNNEKLEASQYIGGISNQLDTYKATISEHDEFELELTKSLNELSKMKTSLIYFSSLEIANKEVNALNDTLQNLLVKKAEMKNTVGYKLDMKQTKMQMLATVETNLSKVENNQNIKELKDLRDELKSELDELGKKLDNNISSNISKDDMIKAVIYLDELKSICDNFILDVVNQDNITKVFESYKKNSKLLTEIEAKYNNSLMNLQQYSALTNTTVNIKMPILRSDCKETSCAYKSFYDNYCSIMNSTENKTQETIRELERQVSKYGDILTIISIIKKCNQHIDKYYDILSKVGFIFNKDNFVTYYMEYKDVYDREKAQSYIELLEDNEKFNSLYNQLKDTEDKLTYYHSTEELILSLNKEKDSLIKEIEVYDREYQELKADYDVLYEKIEKKQELLDNYNKEVDILEKIEEINNSIIEMKKRLSEMDSIMSKIKELQFKKNNYQSKINLINDEIRDCSREKDRLNIIITNMDSLQSEEIEIREKYDLIKNIRFAVSPTTGIPLDFIEYYVKEEMIGRINNLLDSVYHGRLKLIKDMVIVNDKEFTIPYMKNGGTIVKDISKASDGERAILSIAFSLVLIQLSCNKYNIMLLDEIDTSLDANSRGKFIDMIEEYMKLINAEQLFLISHNNMFDTYPVNVILLSDYQSFNYSNASIMRIF